MGLVPEPEGRSEYGGKFAVVFMLRPALTYNNISAKIGSTQRYAGIRWRDPRAQARLFCKPHSTDQPGAWQRQPLLPHACHRMILYESQLRRWHGISRRLVAVSTLEKGTLDQLV